ncbi:Anoctamin-like protein [Diplonema papillatum]|nr:Anoctamin-like protein [Diplonema papillatum]
MVKTAKESSEASMSITAPLHSSLHPKDILASTEYIIGFADGLLAPKALDDVMDYVVTRFTQSGLKAVKDTSANLKLPAQTTRFILVSAPTSLLEQEAERHGYLKPMIKEPGQEQDYAEFARENARSVFAGYFDPSFWSKGEEAALLLSAVEHVSGVEGLRPHLAGLPPAKGLSAQTAFSVFHSLRIAEVIVCSAPLHSAVESARLWKKAVVSPLAPEDALHGYFNCELAMYFAWMNCFTVWLVLPAFVGLGFFVHMQVTGLTVDNHPYLPFYSIFVVFWAICFLSSWRRRSARKAWQWGVVNEQLKFERRPDFRGELRRSRVTGKQEQFFPYRKRLLAYAVSLGVTVAMLGVAFFVMTLSLNLQGYIDGTQAWEWYLYYPFLSNLAAPGAIFDPNQAEYFGVIAFVPTILHVLVIMQLNMLYRRIAEWLTRRENHEFEADHESSLVLKRFLFESFDCYISLFYLGFIQQDIRRLRHELIGLYTVDALRRVLCETVLPFIMNKAADTRKKEVMAMLKKQDASGSIVSAISEIDLPQYEAFDDYLEMVIEFGYVTLFASAFPLAALLSLACNLIEIKSDLFKLCRVHRRPTARLAMNIGIWEDLLWCLTWLSITTNTMLLVSSEQLAQHLPYLYREIVVKEGATDVEIIPGAARWVLLTAFGIERAVVLLALVLSWLIPNVPEDVQTELRRLDFRKAQALHERVSAIGEDRGRAAFDLE